VLGFLPRVLVVARCGRSARQRATRRSRLGIGALWLDASAASWLARGRVAQ